MKRVLAIDPGLATFGAVTCITDLAYHECVDVDVFKSEPRTQKLGHPLAADRERRTGELFDWLEYVVVTQRPDVVAAEGMSFPRGANPIIMISLAWGVIISVTRARGLRVVSAMPMTWRKALVRSGAEKAAHREAIRRVPTFSRRGREISPSMILHARDALGVFAWSVSHPIVRSIIRGARP